MDADIGQRFVETMRAWLISLPHDLKILYEASSDENLDRACRELAIGAIVYLVSPNDAVSERGDFSGYADDCLILRLALRRIVQKSGEDAEFLKGRFSEFFASLEEELAVCKEAMGDLYGWLESRVEHLTQAHYKGSKVGAFLDDEELGETLYEDGLAFATNYPVDEGTLADKFKKASTILEVIQRRKAELDKKR